jgi:hypothetical protein
MTAIIDSDQHLFESPTMWGTTSTRPSGTRPWPSSRTSSATPGSRGGTVPRIADVQVPGDTAALGRRRQRRRARTFPGVPLRGGPPGPLLGSGGPGRHLGVMGLDQAVVFPNFGLLWERRLSESLPALTANMAAWNRWCATVVTEGGGLLHPVAHLTLRDPAWLEAQLAELSAAGVRLAMIAPAAVDGRPLSHPDHDPCGPPSSTTASRPSSTWPTSPGSRRRLLHRLRRELRAGPRVRLPVGPPGHRRHRPHRERHPGPSPGLRIGIVELSSVWVPQYLMMLDGGWEFTTKLNGGSPGPALDSAPERVLPPPGPRLVVLLRATGPAHGQVR